ncbi:MAG: hypothetical protein IIZ61_01845 [Lachnospiraceae bacterium]|nr:hypothetical protein [Lachnospiraceae bacterium]
MKRDRERERERRRHRKQEKKKPYSKKCIFLGGFSAFSIIAYIATLIYTVKLGGEIGKIIPGILMICFVLCAVFLFMGFKEFKKESNFNQISKNVGLFVPLAAVVIFLVTYVVGLITGGV